jgi:tetratricopeptide (TPR) repeat protein
LGERLTERAATRVRGWRQHSLPPFRLPPVLARCFVVALLAALLGGVAAPPSVAQTDAAKDAPLTLSPERPRPGQPVTVRYDPQAPEARLRSSEALELVVRYQQPDYRVLPMREKSGRWQAQFTPDSSARFLRLYVQSDSARDRNGGAVGWGRMLYGADGRPARGAHTARAAFLREHRGEDASDSLLMRAYRRERALHPEHLEAKAHLSALRAERARASGSGSRADSLRHAALEALDAARQRYAGSPAKLREVQRAYYALGRRERAQSVGATLMEAAPRGPEARLAAFRRATAEGQRPARTRRRVEEFLERFPHSFFEGGLYEALFKKYRAADLADPVRVDSMRWAGRQWIRAEQINPARAHGQLAQALAEADRYDAAARHARRAVQAVSKETPAEYSFFKTDSGWDWAPAPRLPAARRRRARRQRGNHRAVLGRVHFRQARYAKAAEVLARAVRERPDDPALWQDLAKAREQAGQPEGAFAAAEQAVRHAPTDSTSRALFRRFYRRQHGSGEGLQDAVARLARPTLMAERLDRPAPPLRTLTRLDSSNAPPAGPPRGEAPDPEALHGTVRVVELWASWCGPCHEAFPPLQATYETYRDAPDVTFMAVNTSWNETKARARRFAEAGGYTVPLYWDAGGQWAQAMGIRSIPATVLIGKGGRVQFLEKGFSGPAQYAERLALRIELLRSLSPGASAGAR